VQTGEVLLSSIQDGAACPSGGRSGSGEVWESLDDHALMARVAHRDEGAFEELTVRHLKSMIAVSQRILRNAAEADEVAQESFLRLWTQAPRWDPNGTGCVRTWLSRVVTNLSLDRLRRRRSVPLDDIDEIEDLAQGAFDTLKDQDRKKLVQRLLDTLPERQKVAVILSYFEEMTGRDIALSMELTEGAVESLLVRARRTLRDGVKKWGFVWGENI